MVLIVSPVALLILNYAIPVQLVLTYPETSALLVIQHVFHAQDYQQTVHNAHLDNTSMVHNVTNVSVTVSPVQMLQLASPVK